MGSGQAACAVSDEGFGHVIGPEMFENGDNHTSFVDKSHVLYAWVKFDDNQILANMLQVLDLAVSVDTSGEPIWSDDSLIHCKRKKDDGSNGDDDSVEVLKDLKKDLHVAFSNMDV